MRCARVFLSLVAIFPLAAESSELKSDGRVVWPSEYVLELSRPLVNGAESKAYLAGVIQNLIGDQLSLQRSAVTRGKLSPLTIEYPLRRDHEALPENERDDLLARFPKPEILPLRIRRSARSPASADTCNGLPEDRYTLLSSVEASVSRVALRLTLCQGGELVHTQKTAADEQELVGAIQRLVNPIRAKLTGDNYASLRIESTPAQASVYLDEQFLGKTPLDYSYLIPGTYRLILKRDGYRVFSEILQTQSGEKAQRKINMQPSPLGGSLDITTTPPGAKIYLDADYLGKTPKRIDNIAAGTYRLHLLHPEKGEVYRTVTLPEQGGVQQIDENLSGFLTDNKPGLLGITYKTWYYLSLFTSATLFGTSIAFYVWRDHAQEQIFARLSGKSPELYTQDDRDFLAQRNREYEQRHGYATGFMVGAGAFAILSLYFYVQHLLSQDEGIVMQRRTPSFGEVEYRLGNAPGPLGASAHFYF